MSLHRLDIYKLRNLQGVTITPSTGFNLLLGPNGSGKTSVLEAIYLLGRGRSFRTSQLWKLVGQGAQDLTVYGQVTSGVSSIGMGLAYDGQVRMQVGGERVQQRALLAAQLPVLLMTPESHRILSEGPAWRRQFLDWGVFHVEPDYLATWSAYQRALRQRNAALRQNLPSTAVTAWDDTLAAAGTSLNRMRRDYLERLISAFERFLQPLLPGETIRLDYRPGWSVEKEPTVILAEELGEDRRVGFTRRGPHRADLRIERAGREARATVSRGEQKLIVAALCLAQAAVFTETQGRRLVMLVDDLPAEFDIDKRQTLIQLLAEDQAQVFVTATDISRSGMTDPVQRAEFHVKQGRVTAQSH